MITYFILIDIDSSYENFNADINRTNEHKEKYINNLNNIIDVTDDNSH